MAVSKRNTLILTGASVVLAVTGGLIGSGAVFASSMGSAPASSVPLGHLSKAAPDTQYEGGHFSSESGGGDGACAGETVISPNMTC